MPSAQYSDGTKKIPTQYKRRNDKPQQCPGKCTCDFGTRSSYDQMQYDQYVKGDAEHIRTVNKIPNWK